MVGRHCIRHQQSPDNSIDREGCSNPWFRSSRSGLWCAGVVTWVRVLAAPIASDLNYGAPWRQGSQSRCFYPERSDRPKGAGWLPLCHNFSMSISWHAQSVRSARDLFVVIRRVRQARLDTVLADVLPSRHPMRRRFI